MMVACLGFGLSGSAFWALLACVTLFFSGFNYLEARFPALVSNIAPAGQRGTAMGIFASFQFFGAFLGGLASGALGTWFDQHWLFILASLSCLCWLFMFNQFEDLSQLKRVTLPLKSSQLNPELVSDKLLSSQGVVEVNPVVDKQVVYLKVNQDFDEVAVRKIILNFSSHTTTKPLT
jgi:MFS family permease